MRRKSRSSKKMSFSGYTKHVKNLMDLRGLGIVVLGLSLPSIAGYLQQTQMGGRVGAAVNQYIPGATSTAGKAVMAVGLTAAVSYALMGFGAIQPGEALTANMIALGLVSIGVLQTINLPVGNHLVSSVPSAGIQGFGSTSYGYIGNYDAGQGVGADMLPQPQPQQLFGVRANIF
jgi:hypothetical protein